MAVKSDSHKLTQGTFNPQTRRTHRVELFWQVSLPLFAGILGCGLLFYLLVAGGAGSIERGGQVAVILLALPALLLGFVLLGLLLALNNGLGRALKWLPGQTARVQRIVEGINRGAQKAAAALASPFIQLESWGAALRRVFKRNR
ncbi:MAG: hypothetical protein WD740_07365 [Anaerolineales bacterium]